MSRRLSLLAARSLVLMGLVGAGCGVETYREAAPAPSIAMRFVAEGETPVALTLPRYDTGESVPLEASVLIQASHVDHVQLYQTGEGERIVVIDLNDVGRARLTEATTARVGARLAIIAGGLVIASPILREPLTGGEAYVRVPADRIEQVFASMGAP